jgi:predicted RNase H-like HicB family nuclease
LTQGDTVEHAFEMAADAIVGRLDVMAKDGDLIPTEVQPSVVRVTSI